MLAFRLWQVGKTKSIPFSPQPSSFVLHPPSESLAGRLVLVKGKVEKEPRDEDKFEEVGVGEEILQGEKLATGEKSQATVEFPDFVEINLASDSGMDFVSLLPVNFLVSQVLGSVSYELLQGESPVSVRILHALLTSDCGESQVTVDREEITIEVFSGSAKLAMVDLENETHVWELKEGQKALVDDSQRRVEIK